MATNQTPRTAMPTLKDRHRRFAKSRRDAPMILVGYSCLMGMKKIQEFANILAH